MIEWQRLEELRDDVGEEEIAGVIDLFLAEIRQALPGLAQSDAHGRVALLHSMKGSARNIGLYGFARICDDEERRILENGLPAVSDADIAAAFAQADGQLHDGLPQFVARDRVG